MARFSYEKSVPNPVKTDRMIKLWCHEARGVLCAPMNPIDPSPMCFAQTSSNPNVPATMDSEELAYFATSIWQLEEVSAATGALVAWEKSYRLRHSLSLKYLAVGSERRNGRLVYKELPRAEEDAGETDVSYYPATLVSAKDIKADKDLARTTVFNFKNT